MRIDWVRYRGFVLSASRSDTFSEREAYKFTSDADVVRHAVVDADTKVSVASEAATLVYERAVELSTRGKTQTETFARRPVADERNAIYDGIKMAIGHSGGAARDRNAINAFARAAADFERANCESAEPLRMLAMLVASIGAEAWSTATRADHSWSNTVSPPWVRVYVARSPSA
jgi:hypothetical protein